MIEMFLLEQLTAFARYGTLSGAAKALNITQPALSRSMKKLEDAVGVPLFDRSKSKIALNETGKVAAAYAEKVLEANREMIEKTVAFDRSRRTIVLGACAALPISLLLPILQKVYPGMAVTSEIFGDAMLIRGLKNQVYQLAVLHQIPEDKDIFYQPFTEEQLSITLPPDHPLASRTQVTFQELNGMNILAHSYSGFWLDICRKHLTKGRLLTQDSIDTLYELVDFSSLPAFSSDRAMEHGPGAEGRVTVPICGEDAHAVYYLACLCSEKGKYERLLEEAGKEYQNYGETSESAS